MLVAMPAKIIILAMEKVADVGILKMVLLKLERNLD